MSVKHETFKVEIDLTQIEGNPITQVMSSLAEAVPLVPDVFKEGKHVLHGASGKVIGRITLE